MVLKVRKREIIMKRILIARFVVYVGILSLGLFLASCTKQETTAAGVILGAAGGAAIGGAAGGTGGAVAGGVAGGVLGGVIGHASGKSDKK